MKPGNNIQRSEDRFTTRTVVSVLVYALVCVGILAGWLLSSQLAGAQVRTTTKSARSIELEELKTALAVARKQLDEERVRANALDETRKALAESLAAANSEARRERAAYQDLLIKMEAMGVDLLNIDEKSLQQRLLKAVRAAELEREQSGKLAQQLIELSEAVAGYLKTAGTGGDAEASTKSALETELQSTDVVLGLRAPKASKAPVTVSRGKVVSMDPEIGLIVLNVGRKGGARVGMPIEILRTDRPIGSAMVVDVRDSICGAVLNELVSENDDVRIGDRIQPKPKQL